MSLDVNLLGLGMPAALAARIASGGTGPVAVTAKGSSLSTGAQLGGKQFVTYVTGSAGWVSLPPVGGDFGPEVADDFVIHNALSAGASLTVGIPAGVTINISGTAYTGSYTLVTLKTLTMWVQSSTQWFGIAA